MQYVRDKYTAVFANEGAATDVALQVLQLLVVVAQH